MVLTAWLKVFIANLKLLVTLVSAPGTAGPGLVARASAALQVTTEPRAGELAPGRRRPWARQTARDPPVVLLGTGASEYFNGIRCGPFLSCGVL